MSRLACGLIARSILSSRFNFTISRSLCDKVTNQDGEAAKEENEEEGDLLVLSRSQLKTGLGQNIFGNLRRPKAKDRSKERDRRIPIEWDVSIKYMDSEAYKIAYGDFHVWQLYRRNRKHRFDLPGMRNRISCIGEDGFIQYAQACPICRDEYLVLDYRNVKLLRQFIQPATQQIYPWRKTNLCQRKYEKLLVEILKAKDHGTLVYKLPFKQFDYRDYYLPEQLSGLELPQEIDLVDDEKLHEELGKPEFGEIHDYSYVDFP